jgi:hypothetical protein
MWPVVQVLLLAAIAGLFFYLVRSRWPLVYGIVEFAVALAIIFVTFFPQTNNLLLEQEPPWWGVQLTKLIGSTAGVYVMVRGLDNIERGLPPTARAQWRRVFYGQGV